MQLSWLIVGVLGVVTVCLNIISLATASWYSYDILSSTYSCGLWQCCVNSNCSDFKDVPDYFWVVRIFLILSLINLIGATFSAIFGTCKKSSKAGAGAAGGFFGGALFLVIGMAVFAGKYLDSIPGSPTDIWGYSFGLGWASAAMSVGLCVLSAALRCCCS